MATAAVEASENPRARIGGNVPPSIKEQALLDGAEALKPLLDRAEELLASAEKAKADDADSAGKCSDLVRMIRACDKALDDKRKEVEKPYAEAAKVFIEIPRAAKFKLSGAKTKLTEMVAEFDRKERQRLKEEQEEKDAAEAANAAQLQQRAAAMGIDLPAEEPAAEQPRSTKPVRSFQSDMGSSAYTRKVEVLTVSDPYALPLAILTHPKVTEAIVSAARELRKANGGAPIKGIIVTEDETTVIR